MSDLLKIKKSKMFNIYITLFLILVLMLYLFEVIVPFALAFIVAYIVSPLNNWLGNYLNKTVASLLSILCFIITGEIKTKTNEILIIKHKTDKRLDKVLFK